MALEHCIGMSATGMLMVHRQRVVPMDEYTRRQAEMSLGLATFGNVE